MKIEIRSDCMVVTGYVNAVGRDSRPILSPTGDMFIEMIEPGTFGKALERASNVELRLNHSPDKIYASTADGNLKLSEDSIGLRAECVIYDAAMIEKGRKRGFRGWSFGMYVINAEMERRAGTFPRRHISDLDIFEVSLIDDTMLPCYAGTSVECRAKNTVLAETRAQEDDAEITETAEHDYTEWEMRLAAVRARPDINAWERRISKTQKTWQNSCK